MLLAVRYTAIRNLRSVRPSLSLSLSRSRSRSLSLSLSLSVSLSLSLSGSVSVSVSVHLPVSLRRCLGPPSPPPLSPPRQDAHRVKILASRMFARDSESFVAVEASGHQKARCSWQDGNIVLCLLLCLVECVIVSWLGAGMEACRGLWRSRFHPRSQSCLSAPGCSVES